MSSTGDCPSCTPNAWFSVVSNTGSPVLFTKSATMMAFFAAAGDDDPGAAPVGVPVKPANIFVSQPARGSKQIKILDFGLARQQGGDLQESSQAATFSGQATSPGTDPWPADLTNPGSTLGTVAYMSPEQAKGEPLNARTDLFSLGAVIYEMATGTKPYAGQSTAEVFVALLTKDPAPVTAINPAMPSDLDGLDAHASPGSSGKVTAAASGTHAEVEARPAAQDVASPEKPRGQRMPLLMGAAVIVLLLAG